MATGIVFLPNFPASQTVRLCPIPCTQGWARLYRRNLFNHVKTIDYWIRGRQCPRGPVGAEETACPAKRPWVVQFAPGGLGAQFSRPIRVPPLRGRGWRHRRGPLGRRARVQGRPRPRSTGNQANLGGADWAPSCPRNLADTGREGDGASAQGNPEARSVKSYPGAPQTSSVKKREGAKAPRRMPRAQPVPRASRAGKSPRRR